MHKELSLIPMLRYTIQQRVHILKRLNETLVICYCLNTVQIFLTSCFAIIILHYEFSGIRFDVQLKYKLCNFTVTVPSYNLYFV